MIPRTPVDCRLPLLACMALCCAPVPPVHADTLDTLLQDGRLNDALATFASPTTDADRFSLALAQSLQSLEQFSAGFNDLGINPELARTGLPFFRVVVSPDHPRAPGKATPAKVGALFGNLRKGLLNAHATLEGISGDAEFAVPLTLDKVRLDLDGDGSASELLTESLSALLGAQSNPDKPMLVQFDQADATWLKGYTLFLCGVLDLLGAYDWMPVWNQSAHLLFLNPDPVPPIAAASSFEGDNGKLADLIAAVHDMRLPLVDPEAPRRAKTQFLGMISGSRECWKRVLAEKDNQDEWLPGPTQTGPNGATISQAEIDGWLAVLNELEAILNGDKLLPHWRMKRELGINLSAALENPPPLDIVLLIQGSALLPYVQKGTVSDRATWQTLTGTFRGNFLRFALWSN